VVADVTADGSLGLSTVARGGHAAIEIDPIASTAASALGLTAGYASARGRGLLAAELVSIADAPYRVPADAELLIAVDGRRRKVPFPQRDRAGNWSAEDAADRINGAIRGLASVTRNGRLRLVSPRVGADSRLRVEAPRPGSTKPNAAAALGFVGSAAVSEPYLTEPARLVCTGTPPRLEVTNLTGSPIELHLASGRLLLPPRRSLPLSPRDAGNVALQRLAGRGAVRLSRARP
jgi:hypothetical protein